ncbi:polyphosphate--glucose phosphotransferase [Trueperella sp. LYQ143]|uniref:polyphosphate--glucose phosphotransferase n=1 Tax=Trueperella sp. LYQ143 TaxID=3391059 RepID=UPI0039832783
MTKSHPCAIGIDVGGSGIKGALVDVKRGKFITERYRIPTPENGSPLQIAGVIREIIDLLEAPADLPVGISFPAPIVAGVVPFMANLSQEWRGQHVASIIRQKVDRPIFVLNDADAAGYAEVRYGAAHGHRGTVIMLTLGTGIGSALVRQRRLIPNTELGHLILDNGITAERFASSAVYTQEGLSFEQWAERLTQVFSHINMLFSPDLFIVGGGISKHHKKFLPLIPLDTPIVPAKLRNAAGVIGAARVAYEEARR